MNNKKTVGFLVSGIMDEFTELLVKGVINEASTDEVNIVVIPVKYIHREVKYESELFDYQFENNVANITSSNLDILIVAADCIGCLTTSEVLNAFMQDLKDKGVPIFLVASQLPGYPGVIFDNRTGIIDGMTYLIKDLGLKKICMIKSQDHYIDIAERYETYLEMMEFYKLEVNPKNVISAPLSPLCRDECAKLLDDNPDVEAIICADDAIAIGLYEEMNERGLIPGKDIKVMGFDNSIKGSMITPSLTTVDANAKKLGARAYNMVKMMMDGWNVSTATIPTNFIIRDSFGSFLDTENNNENILDKANIDEYFHRVFYKYDNISGVDGIETLIMFKTLMNIIIDYVEDEQYIPERVTFLSTKLDEFFKTGALQYTDVSVLVSYADRVKTAVMNRFDSYERKVHAYETYSYIMEKLVLTLRSNVNEYKVLLTETSNTLKNLVSDTLNFTTGNDKSYANIMYNLINFGIVNAYLYLYEEPITHYSGEKFVSPDYVLIKAAMTNRQIVIVPPELQKISIDKLYNNRFVTDNKYNMVLMPLFFHEKVYGTILYDLTDVTFRNGEFLANQYATVIKVIDIMKK
ncbi:MAG: substrate-binding domain-containing protein [Eubacterium sp.]|nr:substrate-binding domain-containing protein [Eubacterium sp.]